MKMLIEALEISFKSGKIAVFQIIVTMVMMFGVAISIIAGNGMDGVIAATLVGFPLTIMSAFNLRTRGAEFNASVRAALGNLVLSAGLFFTGSWWSMLLIVPFAAMANGLRGDD
jgi:hypothetical protein